MNSRADKDDNDMPNAEQGQGWLHIMVGRILAGVESTDRNVKEVKDEVSAMRETAASMRDEVTQLGMRMTQAEKDISEMQTPVSALEHLRGRAMGVLVALAAIGFAVAFIRDLVTIHLGLH